MKVDPTSIAQSLCPSAQPEMSNSVIFGIVGGTVEAPRVAYLNEPQPVTDELLALTQPVTPTEVFRLAAPCARNACLHFDGTQCQLVHRTVQLLPQVVSKLPACRIRSSCRWWQQAGSAACLRCPQVVTANHRPSDQARQAATPGEQQSFEQAK